MRIVLVVAALAGAGCNADRPRELQIVARGMTFTTPADPDGVNPVIHLRAGERVHLTFRNEAPGLMHNFEIPKWGIRTDQIRGGTETSITFTVPDTQVPTQYRCRPHSQLMHGVVEVASQ